MKTENLSTLKIHKLTQEQYNREVAKGTIDPNALYLTPEEDVDYASKEDLKTKADKEHKHTLNEITDITATAAELNYLSGITGNVQTQINTTKSVVTKELNKRPIAYASTKGELNWEFSGNINDYESIVISADETISMVAIKILDIAPSAEEREAISYTVHNEMIPGGTPSVKQTSGQWIAFNGDERAYDVSLDGIPMIAAVYSTISEDGMSFTPGLWVMQMLINGENMLGVQTLYAPSATLPGVKMDPNLIDAEWMAKSGSLEVEVNSENVSEYLTDEINDFASMFDLNAVLKLSDHFMSQAEFVNGTLSVEAIGITVACSEVPLVMGPGTADIGYTVALENLWAYQLAYNVLLIAGENAGLYIHDLNTTFTVPKGVYFGLPSEEDLNVMLALGTLKFYCPAVADIVVPLPEKYLPDMSQYATKEELEAIADNIVEEADLNAMLQEVLQ